MKWEGPAKEEEDLQEDGEIIPFPKGDPKKKRGQGLIKRRLGP